jgi:SAM-dependent methyltransferase
MHEGEPSKEEPINAWNNIFKAEGEVFRNIQEDMPRVEKVFEERGVKTVLDLGCGSGRHSAYLAENGFDVSGFDASPEGIEIAKRNLEAKKIEAEFKVGDIYEKLPYQDASFDAIVSTQVIHHNTIEHIRELIKEMERVLSPKGNIFLTVSKRHGKNEQEIAPDTFVPLSGGEEGLPHYYFNEESLRKEFTDFVIDDIWEEKGGGHYCLLGQLKDKK